MSYISALTESIYILKSMIFSLSSERACVIYDHVTIGKSPLFTMGGTVSTYAEN